MNQFPARATLDLRHHHAHAAEGGVTRPNLGLDLDHEVTLVRHHIPIEVEVILGHLRGVIRDHDQGPIHQVHQSMRLRKISVPFLFPNL